MGDLFGQLIQPSGSGSLPGIVVGVVTDNSDEKQKGLLQVRIPMLEDGMDLLDGVQVLQPYAGAKAGSYFWPEVGDYVLVALVSGGYGRAFILGSFYPSGNSFMENCFHKENNQKCLVTRGGIRVEISDEKGKETISVTTPKKLSITLKDEAETIALRGSDGETSLLLDIKNGKTVVQAEKSMELKCGSSLVRLEKNGTVTVEGKKQVNLKGGNIEAKANAKMKMAGQQFEAAGQISAKVSGQAQAEFSSGGITKVKGGMLQLNS